MFYIFLAIYLNHIPCTKGDINFNSQAKDTLDSQLVLGKEIL